MSITSPKTTATRKQDFKLPIYADGASSRTAYERSLFKTINQIFRRTTMLDIDEMGQKEIHGLLHKVGYGHLGCVHEGKP